MNTGIFHLDIQTGAALEKTLTATEPDRLLKALV